jgi:acetylglutamate kinase
MGEPGARIPPDQAARVLIEALPYIRAFAGKTVVVKYGGAAMERADLKASVSLDVILMRTVGMLPVVVHGGGPQIGAAMERAGLRPRFVGGLRVTDTETMRIVEMVLVGQINQELVALINRHGGAAVGISGKDGGLLVARKAPPLRGEDGTEHDLGLVGEVVQVSPEVLRAVEGAGFIPVVAPTAADGEGVTYNINADVAAGAIAGALQAEKFILLTDTDGILDRRGRLIPTVDLPGVQALIADGTISSGMVPKVDACRAALKGGVRKTHIINGTVPHGLLLEVFTDRGIGTQIVP